MKILITSFIIFNSFSDMSEHSVVALTKKKLTVKLNFEGRILPCMKIMRKVFLEGLEENFNRLITRTR